MPQGSKPWAGITRPAEPNRCPYCAAWFVVEDMTEYHLMNNQCGLVPAPPKGKK